PSLHCVVAHERGKWTDVIAKSALALISHALAAGVLERPMPLLRGLAKSYRAANLEREWEFTLEKLVEIDPGAIGEFEQLARLRKGRGDLEGALRVLTEAAAANPEQPAFHNLKGTILAALGRPEQAIDAYRQGLACAPDAVDLNNNIATSLRTLGRLDEALDHYLKAERDQPDRLQTLLNIGGCLTELGQTEAALARFDRLVQLDPENVEGHYNRAQTLLTIGRFPEGWREFQWRWRRSEANVKPDFFPQPLWSGEDISGKGVLVYTEQGIGDEILVAGFIPQLTKRAGRLVLLASERLVPLFRRSFPDVTVAHRTEPLPPEASASDLAVQMSFSELGACLRPSFANFPEANGFLRADEELTRKLRTRYKDQADGRPLIGISWRSANPAIGLRKSAVLEDFRPILRTADATFVNLQYGDTVSEREQLSRAEGIRILHDPDVDPLRNMDAAAAQIAALDLVISVSNTTVHTAGALGVPTWTLLSANHGGLWYWFRQFDKSPWYPGMRLYRSSAERQWDKVIADMAGDLPKFLAQLAAPVYSAEPVPRSPGPGKAT
ncbi:MAG: tetratricopeptide repeat protein, partial [Rhodobacteraceae bacterium]|nr:tetratricopeptide repeat protein [Paracoccaceae bacterium]